MVVTLTTLINCQHKPGREVQVQDKLIYVDKGPLGALRLHTHNDLKMSVPPEVWDSLDGNKNARFGMLCMSPEDFAQSQTELQLLCSYYGACTYEEVQEVLERMSYIRRTSRMKPSPKFLTEQE